MQNLPLIIVICALLSILPAGVAFMVLWSRIMDVENRISAQLGVKDDIVAVSTELKKSIARSDALDVEISKLDSRLNTYNNRLSVTARHEREREKAEEPEEITPEAEKQLQQFNLFKQPINTQPEQPQRLTLRRKA